MTFPQCGGRVPLDTCGERPGPSFSEGRVIKGRGLGLQNKNIANPRRFAPHPPLSRHDNIIRNTGRDFRGDFYPPRTWIATEFVFSSLHAPAFRFNTYIVCFGINRRELTGTCCFEFDQKRRPDSKRLFLCTFCFYFMVPAFTHPSPLPDVDKVVHAPPF